MRTQKNDNTLSDKNREKYDSRIKKTDRALVKALFTLLSEKSFEDITVQAICDSASIRRATFYTHFSDKYQLFGYAIRYTYQNLPSYQDLYSHRGPSTISNRNKELYIHLIQDALNFILQNLELINSIRESQLIHLMLNIIASEIVDDITVISHSPNNDGDNDSDDSDSDDIKDDAEIIINNSKTLEINFYVKGVLGSIQWWVNENYPISKDELIDQISQLLKYN